jgi:hypothetical protein
LAGQDQNSHTDAPERDTGATARILNQILAHQVSAIVGAAEALQCTILQDDRLEFRKNRLTQSARLSPAHDIANRNGGRCGESEDDKRDANSMSSHKGVLHRSGRVKTILTLVILPSICAG